MLRTAGWGKLGYRLQEALNLTSVQLFKNSEAKYQVLDVVLPVDLCDKALVLLGSHNYRYNQMRVAQSAILNHTTSVVKELQRNDPNLSKINVAQLSIMLFQVAYFRKRE